MESNMYIGSVGEVKISDEVVASIADIAAKEVNGVIGLSGGLTDIIGKRHGSKGIKLEIEDKVVKMDLFLNIEYGIRIPDVAWKIQENVKRSIETMTGMTVSTIDIHIQGIQTPKAENHDNHDKHDKHDKHEKDEKHKEEHSEAQ